MTVPISPRKVAPSGLKAADNEEGEQGEEAEGDEESGIPHPPSTHRVRGSDVCDGATKKAGERENG